MILDIKKKKKKIKYHCKLISYSHRYHSEGGRKKTISTVCDKRDDIEVLYGDNLFRIDTFRKFI